jgi:hypothetical protein
MFWRSMTDPGRSCFDLSGRLRPTNQVAKSPGQREIRRWNRGKLASSQCLPPDPSARHQNSAISPEGKIDDQSLANARPKRQFQPRSGHRADVGKRHCLFPLIATRYPTWGWLSTFAGQVHTLSSSGRNGMRMLSMRSLPSKTSCPTPPKT